MFKNLARSLNEAFGDSVGTRIDSRGMLAIRIGGVELCIDDTGSQVGVSGVGSTSLDVDIDRLGGLISSTAPAVQPSGQ